jgi:hypothetical protein
MKKFVGYFNEYGYRIECNGEEIETAGNAEYDSTVILDPDDPDALSLTTIKGYCIDSGEEIAQEQGGKFLGAVYEETDLTEKYNV